MEIEQRSTSDLFPYALNARLHSPEQVGEIANSIKEFGFNNPILIDANSEIVAGHGRVLAAKQLGMAQVPTIRLGHLTPAQVRAYRLVDNQLVLRGEWNLELLAQELETIQQQDNFQMAPFGFDDAELALIMQGSQDIIADAAEKPTPREITPEEKALLDRAWKGLIEEWAGFMQQVPQRGYLSTEHTRATLGVYFLRALLFGDDIPRSATTAYCLHRLNESAGSDADRPWSTMFAEAMQNEGLRTSIQWACVGRPSIGKLLSLTLGIHGFRAPAEFPALLARDLINEFCPEGGRVLDPCHGWGGRLLGFLLSHAGDYLGFDADPQTTAGVEQMFHDLVGYVSVPKRAVLQALPYERAGVEPGSFDFSVTSPPYYDTEKYDGSEQSWRLYPTFDQWVAGFYRPLLHNTCAALRPGATFALQIGNQNYPLEETALKNLPDGMTHVVTRHTDLVNNYTGTDPDQGEILLILRKD